MRSNVTILKAIPVLTVLLLLFALSSTDPAASRVSAQGVFPQPPDTSELITKAAEEGHVLVIAGLRLATDFRPEGALASPAAIDEQRNDIALTRQALLGGLAGYNAEVYASWDSVPYVALKVDAEALQQLAVSPLVTAIQEDIPEKPALASATAHIGADDTWAAGLGGSGKTAVILDTGIDANHPFYGGRVVDEACWSQAGGSGSGVTLCPGGANTQTGPGSADALTAQCLNGAAHLCDHGSHVAGIAAGRDPGAVGYNGIAPEASIIAIQVFTRFNDDDDCGGTGQAPCVMAYVSDQISALNYVNATLRMSWDIAAANMSIGGGEEASACDTDSRKASIDNLLSNDIATVIASGNDGWTDKLSRPGCISTAVTVGTVFDGNTCGTFDEVSHNMHSVVDLLAVGKCVNSSVPDDTYANKSGTSMAAPQVTGAFAMLSAAFPGMSVNDILGRLKTTGVQVTDTRAANPPGAYVGHTKPRIQLDAAATQPGEPHYKCYDVLGPSPGVLVTLETQFGTETDVVVGVGHYLCPPAVKTLLPDGEPEGNLVGETLLRCYDIDEPPPAVPPVTLGTQFDLYEDVVVGPAKELCVPTLKTVIDPYKTPPPGPLPTKPHYKCYEIAGLLAPPERVDLETQFGLESDVAVGPPIRLCLPAIKTVQPGGEPEGNLYKAHLVCHSIAEPAPDPVRTVSLETQFFQPEPNEVVGLAQMLCVPTLKAAVGGIAELPPLAETAAEGAAAPIDGSSWSAGAYAALAGGLAAAVVALGGAAWYGRRRLLR